MGGLVLKEQNQIENREFLTGKKELEEKKIENKKI